MSSVQEYCQKLSTRQLQDALRDHCEGRVVLPPDTVALIEDILLGRTGEPAGNR